MFKNPKIENIILVKRNKITNIFYERKGNPFYFQLSKGYLAKKILSDSRYIWLGYYNDTQNKKTCFELLNKIKLFIESRLGMDKKKQSLEKFYYANGIGLPLQNINNRLFLEIYMKQTEELWKEDLEKFPEKSYIIPIIHIDSIVERDNRFYLNFKCVQMCVFPIIYSLGRCVIVDNEDYDKIYDKKHNKNLLENDNKTVNSNLLYKEVKMIDHPIYGKYFKMIQMGVPKMAVAIKMKTELLDDDLNLEILENNIDSKIKINLIMVNEHKNYAKFFRMLKVGIPRLAVEQKMNIENLDISYLDKGEELILDINLMKKNSLNELIIKQQLKKSKINKPLINVIDNFDKKCMTRTNLINLNEIIEKRKLILNRI